MAKKAEDDELLAGKGSKKSNGAKKEATKAAPAKAAKGNGKKAAKAEDDDTLEGKSGKATKKPAKTAAAKSNGKGKAEKAHVRAEDIAATDDVRAALLKCKKFTTYADIQSSTGFNIRQIRRTARTMRDAGEVELQKEGTIVSVKRA